jgi:toxin-antitoxin system PIN domain toxin
MILVDTNLLLYAAVSSFSQHNQARGWLDGQLNGSTRVGLPWASLLAFVRIASNPRVFRRPTTVAHAWSRVTAWLDCTNAWVPEPAGGYREILHRFMTQVISSPKLVPDAYLAALAIEHGLILCSTDADFARFPGLRWQNPLL